VEHRSYADLARLLINFVDDDIREARDDPFECPSCRAGMADAREQAKSLDVLADP
jgi:hypothetical protein